jgi:hypothetical protein
MYAHDVLRVAVSTTLGSQYQVWTVSVVTIPMHPSICRSVTCALVPNLTFFTEQSVGLSSRQTYLPLLILYTDDINKTGFLIYSQLFFVIQSDTILQNMTELHGRVVSTPASYSGGS